MATRKLALLFDGTWNKPESNTNVERLRKLIVAGYVDGTQQLVNYIPGVGVSPGITHLLGGAFGYGLSKHVLDGYRWLCETWQTDDQLYLFGFSRGAYTARSLGGLIRKCGLLKRAAGGSVDASAMAGAYDFYRDVRIKPDDPAAVDYRATHAIGIDIHFIGVWETIDDSVWQRWRIDAGYRPPMLVRAMEASLAAMPAITAVAGSFPDSGQGA